MKKLWILFPLGLLSLAFIALIPACSSNPTTPAATPTPVPPTFTPTATVAIVWAYPSIQKAASSQTAFLNMRVNGQAVTTAAVTLSGTFSGAPVVIPYNGYATLGGVQYAQYLTNSFTYQLGAVYTLTTTASGQTASSSVTAPGGLTILSDTNTAVTLISWSNEGSVDSVTVYENAPTPGYTYNSTNSSSDIDSPVTLADSGGGNLYPGGSGSTYSVLPIVRNEATSTAGGSVTLSSNLFCEEYININVTLP